MRRLVTAVLLALIFGVAPPRAARGVVVTVGRLDGTVGEIVRPIIEAAEGVVTIDVVTTPTLDATFFSSIDVFVYANAQSAFVHTMGATARANLVSFVNGGGTAYIGVDLLGDGGSIASAFGFTLADRMVQTSTGTVSDGANAISAGPFQPATSFLASAHGRFIGAAPANGAFIGSSSYGNLLGYRELGAGRVYIFADEVPLTDTLADGFRMLQNVLVGAGADVIPVRPPVVATNSYLLPQRVRLSTLSPERASLGVNGKLDTGDHVTDLSGPVRLTVGSEVFDGEGLVSRRRGRQLSYTGPDFSIRVKRGRRGSSQSRFALRIRGDLTRALHLDAGGSGRVSALLEVDTVAASFDVAIVRGRFPEPRDAGGSALSSPGMFLLEAKGVVRGDGAGSLRVVLGLSNGGLMPTAPTDLRIQLGTAADVTILASEFQITGGAFSFVGPRGGIASVLVSPTSGRITIAGASLDLSSLSAIANPFTVVVEGPSDARSVSVLIDRTKRTLRY